MGLSRYWSFLLILFLTGCFSPNKAKICEERLQRYGKLVPTAKEKLAAASTESLREILGKRIWMFAADHSNDPSHRQVGEVLSAWSEFSPDVVLYENQNNKFSGDIETTVEKYGESGLLRFLANRDDVPADSWEPGSKTKVDHLKSLFPAKQVELLFYMRAAMQLRKQNQASEAELLKFFSETFNSVLLERGVEFKLKNVAQVQAEYRKHWSNPPKWWMAPALWFSPTEAESPGAFLNSIAEEESHFRNVFAYRKITERVLANKKVFFLAGRHSVSMLVPAVKCWID